MKYDLIAKMEQLGPAQFFYTLSCANKRWEENLATILSKAKPDVTVMHYLEEIAGSENFLEVEGKEKTFNNIEDYQDEDEVDELDAAIPVYTLNATDAELTGERKNDYFVHEKVIKAQYDKLTENEKCTLHILCRRKYLDDYIQEQSGMSSSKLQSENVLDITRIFNRRVSSFRKNILMAEQSPMAVQYYHDRVEFQARGHPHIHGLAWSKMDKLETSITGLKLAFQKLKQQQKLGSEDVQALRLFIDSSVSCSRDQEEMMRQFALSAEDAQVVIDRVSQVNVHHHTKTCRKNGTECRFDIPRYPSKCTIVAQGMPEHVKNTEKETVTGISYVQKRVKTVMKELEIDRDERRRNDAAAEIDIDLPTLLEKCLPIVRISDDANIITVNADEDSRYNFKTLHVIEAGEQNQDSDILISPHLLTREKLRSLVYHYCLTVCDYGTKVILKRNVPDIFVNNYNPHWMLAWNGNMDLPDLSGLLLDYNVHD